MNIGLYSPNSVIFRIFILRFLSSLGTTIMGKQTLAVIAYIVSRRLSSFATSRRHLATVLSLVPRGGACLSDLDRLSASRLTNSEIIVSIAGWGGLRG